MHDAKGRELKPGDRVMVPCIIEEIYTSETHCNAKVVSIATMLGTDPPSKLSVSAINTRQVLRANEGDDLTFEVVQDGAHTVLR